ncbi:MAG: site-2 protease family protein [Clostridia bacterium]|nr:site-2 protease family protein [Clostridia bacterium]
MSSSLIHTITELLFVIPCVLVALSVHEVSHGWMAYRLGDPTAKNLGRLSLNPLKHLDPVGTLCMIFFHFGWARPVPINTRYFKNNRRDTALTALAGPLSNIALAFLGTILFHIIYAVGSRATIRSEFSYNVFVAALTLFSYFRSLNLALAVFNLIPVPPLDGSRIFLVWLPPKYYFGVMKYERYIQLGLMILLWTGILSPPLSPVVNAIGSGMDWLVELIPFFRR